MLGQDIWTTGHSENITASFSSLLYGQRAVKLSGAEAADRAQCTARN